jgi:hypothetical protein
LQNVHDRLFDLFVRLIQTDHEIHNFFCSNHHIYRNSMLRVVETQDYNTLFDTVKDLREAMKWLMKTNLLTQFFLTSKCLEWFSSAKTTKKIITDTTEWAHNTSSS